LFFWEYAEQGDQFFFLSGTKGKSAAIGIALLSFSEKYLFFLMQYGKQIPDDY
jgi:hypothetical protein